MESAALAAAVTALLAPYLANAGETLAEKIGEVLPEPLGNLWAAIAEKFKSKPAAEEAAKDLAAAPLDEDNQAAFRKELKKALNAEAEFIQQLLPLLQAAQRAQVQFGDIFEGDNAFHVDNNYGTIVTTAGDVEIKTGDVIAGGTKHEVGTQITDSTVGGDVIGHDKTTSGN